MIKENGDRIGSVNEVDFYIRGNVKIPDSAIIIAPKAEEKRTEEKNPSINVISHNSKDVREYIEQTKLISKLGYLRHIIGEHGFTESSLKESKNYKTYMEELGYTNTQPHYYSIDKIKEVSETFVELMKSLRKRIEEENLDNETQREKYAKLLDKITSSCGLTIEKTSGLAMILECNEQIGTNNLREFGLERFMIQRILNYNISNEKLAETVIENIYINKFFKQHCDSLTIRGETIVEENIEKAIAINNLMKQEDFEYEREGNQCLQILMKHIYTNLDDYKKYFQKEGKDWNQKQIQLDEMLEPLGLDCEYIEEKQEVYYGYALRDIMERIDDNNNIKYIMQMKKLKNMLATKVEMDTIGKQDSKWEQDYEKLLQKLAEEIDVEYLNHISAEGLIKKFNSYAPMEINYEFFGAQLQNRQTNELATTEERFQGLKAKVDELVEIEKTKFNEVEIEELRQYYRTSRRNRRFI